MENFILTGASGAIGSLLLPRLLDQYPESSAVAIFRTTKSAEKCKQGLQPEMRDRIRLCIADIANPYSMELAANSILRLQDAVGIHLAADVSWEKTAEELRPVNVGGAMNFSRFLQKVVDRPKLVFVSTAFTQMENWIYRNGYEETKAIAERQLREDFGRRHPMITYGCSLVVGRSDTGYITRFHGIYPLIRFLAKFYPPFLVGRKEGRFDLIPIDWAVEQLLHAIDLVSGEGAPESVVAAAGEKRITYERLVQIILDRINSAHSNETPEKVAELPILRMRQWKFIKRSLSAWTPSGLHERDFRYFERLLDVYGKYAEHDDVRSPLHTSSPAPSPENYLPTVIDFWLSQEGNRALTSARAGAQ